LTYDDNGNLVTRTDGYNTALARTTTQNYDALDRLIQVVDPYNGAAKPTVYDYNSLDQLTQVTDPEGRKLAVS
jgi:YD repeat-containing protein